MNRSADSLHRNINRQQGFTLIEILVAVLILSLGVLGLIAMESLALQSNMSAYHRSQATILAYDLSDKMRTNPAGVAAGEYIVRQQAQVPDVVEVGVRNKDVI